MPDVVGKRGAEVKSIVIIQARMNSTRLPEKVLLPLGQTVNLEYVVSRCRLIHHQEDVIVATSDSAQDDPIYEWCLQHGVTTFRGSEEDVLARFFACAKQYEADYIIRVTGDCPFVDFEMANDIVDSVISKKVDYVFLNGRSRLPHGLAVEVVSLSALDYMYHHIHTSYHREHVTYYIFEHPEQFSAAYLDVPVEKLIPELRLTLDTEEDYAVCLAIARHFQPDLTFSSQQAIDYLIAHPEVAKLNVHVEQKQEVIKLSADIEQKRAE